MYLCICICDCQLGGVGISRRLVLPASFLRMLMFYPQCSEKTTCQMFSFLLFLSYMKSDASVCVQFFLFYKGLRAVELSKL
jgi:hypothetical protein